MGEWMLVVKKREEYVMTYIYDLENYVHSHTHTIEQGGKFQGNNLNSNKLNMICLWENQVEIVFEKDETWVWNTIKSSDI